jgi:hypothetical protein
MVDPASSPYAPVLPGNNAVPTPSGVGTGALWDYGGQVYNVKAFGAKGGAISCQQTAAWGSSNGKGIHITDNEIWANSQNLYDGIILGGGATSMDDVELDRNFVGVTSLGLAAGKTIVQGLALSGTMSNARIRTPWSGNGVSYTYTNLAYAYETLLTTTGATDVVKQRPAVAGLYRVAVYFRVITGATNVTIDVTYYDATGALITVNVLLLTSEAVGSYRFAPLLIGAQGATESQYIKVTATAGTASRVYVSASIQEAF